MTNGCFALKMCRKCMTCGLSGHDLLDMGILRSQVCLYVRPNKKSFSFPVTLWKFLRAVCRKKKYFLTTELKKFSLRKLRQVRREVVSLPRRETHCFYWPKAQQDCWVDDSDSDIQSNAVLTHDCQESWHLPPECIGIASRKTNSQGEMQCRCSAPALQFGTK